MNFEARRSVGLCKDCEAMTDWRGQTHDSPGFRGGADLQISADAFCATLHAHQSVAVAGHLSIESSSVVAYSQDKQSAFESQLNVRFIAARMTNDVVDRLLENEKHIAANIGTQLQVEVVPRNDKAEIDVPISKDISRKTSHSPHKFTQRVAFRVNRPDD